MAWPGEVGAGTSILSRYLLSLAAIDLTSRATRVMCYVCNVPGATRWKGKP